MPPSTGFGRLCRLFAVRAHIAPNTTFPVYILNLQGDDDQGNQSGHGVGCRGICAAVPWPPVLTSMLAAAGPGIDRQDLGTIVRPDGTHQVTYHGHPLYLFYGDAYIPGVTGTQGIFGQGKVTPWGVFNTVSPSA